VFTANTAFGVFSIASRVLHDLDQPLLQGSLQLSAKIFLRSLLERKQFLESSPLVVVGKNCQIDPRAIVRGPTIIGDNVAIEPGAVINNCVIGNNVSIQQGCQLYASVVGSGTFLPFRASLFMTTMMENSMVAQNTCLQMCVLGRNTFVGAGNTFTDFNLLAKPIKTTHKGKLVDVHLPVLGGCVGHNCRIGSGHIVFPGRIIESDVVLFAKDTKHVIDRNVLFSASDHHNYPNEKHVPLYQPQEE
jgi:NDP-sugar pyrophosphorylase family protein